MTFSMLSAVATTDQSVTVTFDDPAKALSPIGTSDALNVASWSVEDSDGDDIPILEVEALSTTEYTLHLLGKLQSYQLQHTVFSSVVDATGVVLTSPSIEFSGLVALELRSTPAGTLDFANRAFPGDESAGGVLSIGSGGDYALHGGVEFLRKLVIRRLSALPGSYFHIPQYGVGLRLKEPLRIHELGKLRAEVEKALQREPEFSAVRARLELSSAGVLTVEVRARVSADNSEVVIPVAASPDLAQL